MFHFIFTSFRVLETLFDYPVHLTIDGAGSDNNSLYFYNLGNYFILLRKSITVMKKIDYSDKYKQFHLIFITLVVNSPSISTKYIPALKCRGSISLPVMSKTL